MRRVNEAASHLVALGDQGAEDWGGFVRRLIGAVSKGSSPNDESNVDGVRVYLESGAQVTERYFMKRVSRGKAPIGTNESLIICLPSDDDYRVILSDDDDASSTGKRNLKRGRSTAGRLALLSDMGRNTSMTPEDKARLEQAVWAGGKGVDSFFENAASLGGNIGRKKMPSVGKRQQLAESDDTSSFDRVFSRLDEDGWIDLMQSVDKLSIDINRRSSAEAMESIINDAATNAERSFSDVRESSNSMSLDALSKVLLGSLDDEEADYFVQSAGKDMDQKRPLRASPPPMMPDLALATPAEQNRLLMQAMQEQMKFMTAQTQLMSMNQKTQGEALLAPLAPTAPKSGRRADHMPVAKSSRKKKEPVLLTGEARRAKIEKWLAKRDRAFKRGLGKKNYVLSKEQIELRKKNAKARQRTGGRFAK